MSSLSLFDGRADPGADGDGRADARADARAEERAVRADACGAGRLVRWQHGRRYQAVAAAPASAALASAAPVSAAAATAAAERPPVQLLRAGSNQSHDQS
jgi:hypothetical protein